MTRWKVIPEDQRAGAFCVRNHLLSVVPTLLSGIRNFIVGLTIKLASDETIVRRERAYLGKLNLILVQVCLYLWKETRLSNFL